MTAYQDFIDDSYIEGLIRAKQPEPGELKEILAKAKLKRGLCPEDTARLCNLQSPDLLEELFETARSIKKDIYGNRIVFFAPLYVNNFCENNCSYCAFRESNTLVARHSLSDCELVEEVKLIQKQGHKRIILVFGESPLSPAQVISETVRKVYEIKTYNETGTEIGSIRRININAAPLDVEDYRIVKSAGIGTFQVFQETYHKETYRKVHPKNTRKGDYHRRLFSLHTAQEGGIDDVGIGALFGLYDWRFEVVSLICHARSLEEHFGVGPHTISFPRIEPAFNTAFVNHMPFKVSDDDFKKIIAIIRLAVPYTGLILTCRETAEVRNEVIKLGVSQIDAGSRIGIGGYTEAAKRQRSADKEQFRLGDDRSLNEVIDGLLAEEYIPSFCTACYRLGRTGEHFMEQAKPGFIKSFCEPNAMLTFYEYLLDYAPAETVRKGEELINRLLPGLEERIMETTRQRLAELKNGRRDLYL